MDMRLVLCRNTPLSEHTQTRTSNKRSVMVSWRVFLSFISSCPTSISKVCVFLPLFYEINYLTSFFENWLIGTIGLGQSQRFNLNVGVGSLWCLCFLVFVAFGGVLLVTGAEGEGPMTSNWGNADTAAINAKAIMAIRIVSVLAWSVWRDRARWSPGKLWICARIFRKEDKISIWLTKSSGNASLDGSSVLCITLSLRLPNSLSFSSRPILPHTFSQPGRLWVTQNLACVGRCAASYTQTSSYIDGHSRAVLNIRVNQNQQRWVHCGIWLAYTTLS